MRADVGYFVNDLTEPAWKGSLSASSSMLDNLIESTILGVAASMALALDTNFDGLPELTGAIIAVKLTDDDDNPNRVIGDKAPFNVTVDWTVSPQPTAVLLDGTWTVNFYADSIGPGPEAKIGTTTVAATGALNYTTTITVPYPYAGLAEDETPPPDSGVYQLIVVLTYRTAAGVQTEMAAFAQGPTFMLREP